MSSGVESEDESTSVQSTPRGSDGVGMRVENGMAVHGFGDPFAGAGDEFTQQEREMEMQLDAEREIERIEVEGGMSGKRCGDMEDPAALDQLGLEYIQDDPGSDDDEVATAGGEAEDDESLTSALGLGDESKAEEGPPGETSEEAQVRRKRKRKSRATVCLVGCDYRVVAKAAKDLGFRVTNKDTYWTLRWTDRYLLGQTLREMKMSRMQRINHFPAMCEIAFKCRLAMNLNRMMKQLPAEYDFVPDTWILPEDTLAFVKVTNEKKNRTYIVKPNCGSQGQGIFLTRKAADIPKEGRYVAQRYLNKPLLIDGLKFDLRVYVLITSVSPLRLFVADEGLARFCTEEYQGVSNKNVDKQFMHLTNYAINKLNEDFEDGGNDGDAGSKRSITSVRTWLDENGFSGTKVWERVQEVIAKTVIAALPANQHAYRIQIPESRDAVGFTCFTVLGLDVMLDEQAKPWVIEVNELPSFETDSDLDMEVKFGVVREALAMVSPTVQEVRLLKEMGAHLAPGQRNTTLDEKYRQQRRELVALRIEQEENLADSFHLIYPCTDPARRATLEKCIVAAETVYKSAFGGKVGDEKPVVAEARPWENSLRGSGKPASTAGAATARNKDARQPGSELPEREASTASTPCAERSIPSKQVEKASSEILGRPVKGLVLQPTRPGAPPAGAAKSDQKPVRPPMEPKLARDVLRAGQGGLLAAVAAALRRKQEARQWAAQHQNNSANKQSAAGGAGLLHGVGGVGGHTTGSPQHDAAGRATSNPQFFLDLRPDNRINHARAKDAGRNMGRVNSGVGGQGLPAGGRGWSPGLQGDEELGAMRQSLARDAVWRPQAGQQNSNPPSPSPVPVGRSALVAQPLGSKWQSGAPPLGATAFGPQGIEGGALRAVHKTGAWSGSSGDEGVRGHGAYQEDPTTPEGPWGRNALQSGHDRRLSADQFDNQGGVRAIMERRLGEQSGEIRKSVEEQARPRNNPGPFPQRRALLWEQLTPEGCVNARPLSLQHPILDAAHPRTIRQSSAGKTVRSGRSVSSEWGQPQSFQSAVGHGWSAPRESSGSGRWGAVPNPGNSPGSPYVDAGDAGDGGTRGVLSVGRAGVGLGRHAVRPPGMPMLGGILGEAASTVGKQVAMSAARVSVGGASNQKRFLLPK